MVEIKKNREEYSKYFCGYIWFFLKNFFIIAQVVIGLLCVGFITLSCVFHKYFLIVISSGLVITFIVFLFYVLKNVSLVKKSMDIMFENADVNGDVNYKLFKEDGKLVIENLNKKTVFRYKPEDIKLIKKTKKFVFIIVEFKGTLIFPNTIELERLLNSIKLQAN